MAALRKELIVHRDPEHLEAGDSLEVFLQQFPSVTREQAIAALELAREVLTEDAHPA